MSTRDAASADFQDVLRELRRLRRDTARREDELWEAMEELRALLLARQEDDDASAAVAEALDYARLKRRLRHFVRSAVAAGSTVAVVSRGDDDLLELPGMEAIHFPGSLEGGYAGYYPPDGLPLVAHLEWLRARGAKALVFPETSLWWLDSFPRFAAHLRRSCPPPERSDGVGELYDLEAAATPGIDAPWEATLADILRRCGDASREAPSLLDWDTGRDLAQRFPDAAVFAPPEADEPLPYLSGSADLVAVAGSDPVRLAEARRVAAHAVIRFEEEVLKGESGTGGGNGHAGLVVESRGDPLPPPPTASVVIPTYNGIRHLEPCVRSLARTLPADFNGEVVVVDDGGTRETRRALRRLAEHHTWLRVVHNRGNAGFIASCNRGAREAIGRYLVFLNDDTVTLPGWLGALLRTFSAAPDAGAVGGRLVYPDGRLQEAGGVIYRDGSGANVGRGDYEVEAPLYDYLRRVDYCSGALLATPRELFHGLGGFDLRYRPAYYEDTDYCFAVRAAGRSVYYQPEATVVHTEGATSGTDADAGVKRYQAVNRRAFRTKWAASLEAHLPAPRSYTSLTWHRIVAEGAAR